MYYVKLNWNRAYPAASNIKLHVYRCLGKVTADRTRHMIEKKRNVTYPVTSVTFISPKVDQLRLQEKVNGDCIVCCERAQIVLQVDITPIKL